jgi:F-type H+-transporting ATPase subunit b
MEILNQLGELFLAAIPTVIIVLLFYGFLRWSFFGPLQRVMAEREAKIEGARHDTEALRAAAEEKRRAHLDGLRKARLQIFSEQEAARRLVLEERNAAVQDARNKANEEINAARQRIAADLAAARNELQRSGDALADEIVRSVLEKARLSPVGEVQ